MNNKSKQKRIFLSPPHMSGEEIKLVREAFKSNDVALLGPMVEAFEKEFGDYVGIKHCLALASGTAAMHLALRVLGIKRGAEVAASTMTCIGSITPIIYQGAQPIFIDSERESWNMDPDLLAGEISAGKEKGKLPKAVIPTDLYGQCADYDRIFEICKKDGIPVIVDSAEALGAKYRTSKFKAESSKSKNDQTDRIDQIDQTDQIDPMVHAGKGAKAAIFSFGDNEILNTSGGGMLVSDDPDFIEQARFLTQQDQDPFTRPEHSIIGYDYQMSNILAAIGLGQLRVLDEKVEKKRRIFDYYRQALEGVPGIEFMPEPGWSRSTRCLTVILITPKEFGADREAIRLALEAENIESCPVWKPMHLQPVFKIKAQSAKRKAQSKNQASYQARMVGGGVSEDLFARGLCLPSGTRLTEKDLDRVIRILRKQHR